MLVEKDSVIFLGGMMVLFCKSDLALRPAIYKLFLKLRHESVSLFPQAMSANMSKGKLLPYIKFVSCPQRSIR